MSHNSIVIVSRGSQFHHTSHAALAQIEPLASATAPNTTETSTEALAMSSQVALRVTTNRTIACHADRGVSLGSQVQARDTRNRSELTPAMITAMMSSIACAVWK